MVLLCVLVIYIDVGVTPFDSPWAPSELVLIIFRSGLITIWTQRIKFVDCVLWQRLSLRPIFYFVALSTMRSEGDFIVFSEILSLSEFFNYVDQWCLALYLCEATLLREHTLQLAICRDHTSDQLIAASFSPLSQSSGVKRSSNITPSRSVKHCTSLSRQRYSSSGSRRRSITLCRPWLYPSVTN